VTWDDHEVEDNYAAGIPRDGGDADRFLLRRAAAYQAYFEHMPLRLDSMPAGPAMQIYRRLVWGDLAAFHVLDTRQYRTDQPCGDGLKPLCPAVFDPGATLLGDEQERWLFDGLDRSTARWNVLAQQVMLAPLDLRPGPESAFLMDQWAAYPAARDRLLRYLAEGQHSNPVVITGDFHANVVSDLHADFNDPASPVVGTEFAGTSISSAGDGFDTRSDLDALRADNPWIRFYNGQRGYVRCEVTRGLWRADFRVLDRVSVPGMPVRTRASWVIEEGMPGVIRA
jgi:alkaline phosphatase D